MSQANSSKLVFGNWALRGKAHVIRLLMEHLKIPYQERIYKTPQSWYEDPLFKSTPNMELPYLVDQDFTITGTIPIISYILKCFGYQNFLGESHEDQAIVDMHSWKMEIIFKKLISISTKNDLSVEEYRALKEDVWKCVILPKLQVVEDALTQGNWYLKNLSVIDFDIYEFINYMRLLFPSKMDTLPKMQQIEKKISELPEIKNYSNSLECRNICFLPVEMCKRFRSKTVQQ